MEQRVRFFAFLEEALCRTMPRAFLMCVPMARA